MVDIYVEYMFIVVIFFGIKCNMILKMREIIDFEK